MEKSCNSSMMKDDPSKQATNSCTQEESGWTAYFEDFSNNNYREEAEEAEQSPCLSFGCTSSLVSDAGSGAAWRKLDSHNNQNLPKKLSFKKTRTKKISGDDLEDTASSPVNSPKIGDLRPAGSNHRKIDDDHHMNMHFLGKEGPSNGDHLAELDEHAEDGKIRDGCGKNDTSDLKKRGLCLVPMSLLAKRLEIGRPLHVHDH